MTTSQFFGGKLKKFLVLSNSTILLSVARSIMIHYFNPGKLFSPQSGPRLPCPCFPCATRPRWRPAALRSAPLRARTRSSSACPRIAPSSWCTSGSSSPGWRSRGCRCCYREMRSSCPSPEMSPFLRVLTLKTLKFKTFGLLLSLQ